MNTFNYYTGAFKKYADFEGRATRSEFWYFVLFNFIFSLLLSFIDQGIGGIYQLAVLIPSLAIGSRRLHDINRSGWMQLVGLIPLIGFIWLIVLFAQKTKEENNYNEALVPDGMEKESAVVEILSEEEKKEITESHPE